MPEIEPTRLREWLAAIATTQEEEMDCDILLGFLEEVVEATARGEDVRSLLPEVAVHLDHCPDCRDLYETLLALMEEHGSSVLS